MISKLRSGIVSGICLLSLTTYTSAIELISVNSLGEESNQECSSPALSGNGLLVSFSSSATNLVTDDNNMVHDVFVRDWQNKTTTRISVDSDGNEGNGHSGSSDISANNRYVVFTSSADNLVSDDTNSASDVFRHDLETGETIRVSLDAMSNELELGAEKPKISADGNLVAFTSKSPDVVPGDTDDTTDVFIKNILSGEVSRVSFDETGNDFTSSITAYDFSSDGSTIAIAINGSNPAIYIWSANSNSTNRIPSDGERQISELSISANGRQLAYRLRDNMFRDLVKVIDTKTYKRASVSPSEGNIQGISISGSGQEVAYSSTANFITLTDASSNSDVFVRNVGTGLTDIISYNRDASQATESGWRPKISANGAYTVFSSGSDFDMPLSGPSPRLILRRSHPQRSLILKASEKRNKRGKRRHSVAITNSRPQSFYLLVENNSVRIENPILTSTPLRKSLYRVTAFYYKPGNRRNISAGLVKGSKALEFIYPRTKFPILVRLKRRVGRTGSQRLKFRLQGPDRGFKTPNVKVRVSVE